MFIKLNFENNNGEWDVVSLYEDLEGIVWIGTFGSGLQRLHNGKILSCTTKNGLHDDYIFSIPSKKWMEILKIKDKENSNNE